MRLFRRVGSAALVCLAGAVAAPSLTAQRPAPAPVAPEVRKLEFRGVKNVDVQALEKAIATQATRCISFLLTPICRFSRFRGFEERHYLDHKELQRDVLRIRVFYFKHGFREAQVDTVVAPLSEKTVAVRFDIVEGPATLVTQVVVNYDSTLLSPKTVDDLTLLKVADPLDLFRLDSTRVLFQNELWELGYADALVDTSSIVDPVARTAQVHIRLVPNHVTTVGPIVITGAEKVSPSVVLNSLSFKTGDLYRRSDVIQSQRNLYESSLFKLAALEVAPSFDSSKTVNVLLREAPLHEARLSAGFNTVDYIQTDARYTAYNLFGGARRLELSGTLGNLLAGSLNGRGLFRQIPLDTSISGDASVFLRPTWQASATIVQPAFLQRPRNSLSVGAFAQRRAIPAVVIDAGYGGNVTFTRQVGLRTPASLTYRFEVTRVEAGDPYFCVNFGVCDTTSIFALRAHYRLSPAALQWQTDRADQPLSPTHGYRSRIELESASRYTVSDYAYNRASADGTYYTLFGQKDAVLASHIRIGFVRPYQGNTNGVLHPRKRFYAGGAQSVRGFGENQLGPRILTVPHGYLIHALNANGTPCDAFSVAIRFCDPNTAADSVADGAGVFEKVDDSKFTPRPLGGTSVVEGSIEYRFPLPWSPNLGGALFVDGAAVGERVFDPLGAGISSLGNLTRGKGAITPGFGIRYYSPVGPIRIDVGINTSAAEELAVVTEIVQNGKRVIVPLDIPRLYSATGTNNTAFRNALNRLNVHLSIGQAY
jgi:outer membrane protein insertion porin family